jgi:hypothetical protein
MNNRLLYVDRKTRYLSKAMLPPFAPLTCDVPCIGTFKVFFVLRLPLKSVACFTRTKRQSTSEAKLKRRSQPHLLHYTALDLVVTQQ